MCPMPHVVYAAIAAGSESFASADHHLPTLHLPIGWTYYLLVPLYSKTLTNYLFFYLCSFFILDSNSSFFLSLNGYMYSKNSTQLLEEQIG